MEGSVRSILKWPVGGLVRAMALGLAVLSCGGGGNDNGTDPTDENPPTVTQCVVIGTSVGIPSTADAAVAAKQSIQAHLRLLADSTSAPFEVLGNLAALPYDKSGDCWESDNMFGSCNYVIRVCRPTNEEYEWTLALSGTGCDDSGMTYTDWVATRILTRSNSGSFRVYRPATETVMETLTWECAADRKTQTWTYYAGSPDPSRRLRTIQATVQTDGAKEIAYLEPGIRQIMTSLGPGTNPSRGSMETSVGEAGGYRIAERIEWNDDGTGARITYGESGQEIARLSW